MTAHVEPAAAAARAGPLVERAYSVLEIKRVQDTDDLRIIEGMATTPSPDRLGDVVEPLGGQFKNPLPLLHQHHSDEPVGFVTLGKPTKEGIPYTAKFAKVDGPQSLKDRIELAWAEVKAKLVRGVSIGFRSIENSVMKDGGIRFLKYEILELSLVTIPAQAEATISVIKSLDTAMLAASGNGHSGRSTPAGVTAKTSTTTAVKGRPMSKRTIAEAIASYEATRKQKSDEMDSLMEKSIESGETLAPEDKEKYDTLEVEIKELDEHLTRLKRHQEANVSKAVEVRGADPAQASESRASVPAQPIRARVPVEKGTGFIRIVQCLVNAKGDLTMAERFAMQRANQWDAETPGVVEAIKGFASEGSTTSWATKAAVAPGTTTTTAFAGALVQYQVLASEFMEYLRPRTVIGRIPGLRRVPFNVRVPRQTGGSTVGWVGQASVKPVSSIAVDTITLDFTKIAGIIVISEELARFSNPSAEAIIRQDLSDAIIQYMDSQFTDPTVAAVTNLSPASITNGVTPVNSTGVTAAALRTDLLNVLNNFTANSISLAGLVGIMTESQALAISLMQTSLGNPAFPTMSATGGTLNGIPIVTSENIAATGGSPADGYPIIFLRARDILLADDGQVTIDASNQASLQMDTAPTSPATTDTIAFSLWQNNCVGIRAERFINWVKGRSTAVEYIASAKYAE